MGKALHLTIAALLVAILFMTAAGAVAQTTYSLTVSTDQSSYGGNQTIKMSGSVAPAPGPSTAVTLKLTNPDDVILGVWEATVGASSGLFNYSIVAGGSTSWVPGTYTVNATWGAYPPQLYAQATFTWTSSVTTTTTSTTSTSVTTSTGETSTTSTTTTSTTTTTTTTTTSTTTTTTKSTTTTTTTASSSTSTTSTSSSSGGGIPEFPFQALYAGILVAVVAAGYLLTRKPSQVGRRAPLAR